MTLAENFNPYIKYDNGEVWSFCRGKDATEGKISEQFNSISQYWVDIITSPFDQDVSALFVGPKGSGKSSTVISICYEAAHKVAAWVNDGSTWDDYWNLHELTACILEEEATRLMNIQRRYIIKNFDDIGIGWGARKWREEENMQKNDIIQINRTDNCIQCLSVPDQFLIDKVPRRLISHFIEMDQKLFEKGYTTIKMFKPRVMFREDKVINPYLVVDRNKFVNYIIPAPPHDIWTEYKKLRARNKDIAIRRRQDEKVKSDERKRLEEEVRMEKLLKTKGGLRDDTDGRKVSKAEQQRLDWEDWFRKTIPEFARTAQETGKDMDTVIARVCRKYGMEQSPLRYFRKERFVEKFKLKEIVV